MSDKEIIHVAGPTLTFGSITRQRCCWCGALIQEYDLANIAMPEADRALERQGKPLEADELGWWTGLVAVSGTNPVCLRAVDDPEDGKAPERSCMMLMPEDVSLRAEVPALREAREIVDEQARDEGVWFVAESTGKGLGTT